MPELVPIDLRSDTVTRPDAVMRAAMADAEVGDDVLDGDPTMRRLEERVADLLGTAAAVWVPSGSMGNLIALMTHLRRGDRFLATRGAHVLNAELGTAAWLAGGMPVALDWDGAGPGRCAPTTIGRTAGTPGPYYTLRTALLCLENTHNEAGGTVTPVEEHERLVAAGRASGLAVHLDGARLWNAAVALGVSPGALAAGVDTVQVCLSKGLGAPVGSVVAGSAAFATEARRLRKMLGGGVRQGGVLAAAGLIALDRIDDLRADHEHAATLAAGLAELGWSVRPPETNILLVDGPDAAAQDPTQTVARLASVGVLAVPSGGQVRLCTHRDVSSADITETLRRIGSLSG